MIAFIKKHKIALLVLTGLGVLYWLFRRGTFSASAPDTTDTSAQYAAQLAAAGSAPIGSGGGIGGGSVATPSALQNFVTPGGAVTQPGTSASGVPSSSNHTQEFAVNTPNPITLPVQDMGPIVNPPAPTPTGASPFSSVTGSADPNTFTTSAYIKGLNQNISAWDANKGLAPGFDQPTYNAVYDATLAPGNFHPDLYNAIMGNRDVIDPGEVYREEFARAGVSAGPLQPGDARLAGFDAQGNPIVTGRPTVTTPPATTAAPAPATTPLTRPIPTFTTGGGAIASGLAAGTTDRTTTPSTPEQPGPQQPATDVTLGQRTRIPRPISTLPLLTQYVM